MPTTREVRCVSPSKTSPSRKPSSSRLALPLRGTNTISPQKLLGPGRQVWSAPVCVSSLANACIMEAFVETTDVLPELYLGELIINQAM